MTGIKLRAALLSSAAMWLLLWPAAAQAADFAIEAGAKPAVDAVNGKLEGFGGWADGAFGGGGVAGGALGSLTIPLGERFGAQVDGLAAVRDGDFVGGGAGHIFTRDPGSYLFGLYGSGVGFDDRVNSWNAKIAAQHGILCLGLACGLPQVAVPQHMEQLYHGRRAEEAGVLRVALHRQIDVAAFRALVRACLADEAMARRARALAHDLRPLLTRDPRRMIRRRVLAATW